MSCPTFACPPGALIVLRFARDYIKRFPGGASLLALLGRKLIAWWRFWRGKLGSYRGRNPPRPPRRPFVETEASPYSVSGGSAIVGEYVFAASSVPQSASHASLPERTDEQQLATVAHPVGTRPSAIASSLSVDHPYGSPQLLGTRGLVNRSSGSLSAASIQSSASDRFSIITTSRDSFRSTRGQPSRLPRSTHRQFGRGPDPSRSRERPSPSSSPPNTPSTRPHTPSYPPSLEIITTNLPSAAHETGRVSPLVPSSASSAHTHQPPSTPTSNEVRRRRSSTSLVVDVQNPSTESLPIATSTINPPITEEPLAMESVTTLSSHDLSVVDQHDGPVPGSPTSSNAATSFDSLPEGRFIQLINSEQIPRYNMDALMQVEYAILSPLPYFFWQTSRGDMLRCEAFNNYVPIVSCNLNNMVQSNRVLSSLPEQDGVEQDSMIQEDCSPWVPATHPDGGLYFYDEERVRVSMITEPTGRTNLNALLKRLFTDTDMHNTKMKDEIEHFYGHLLRFLQNEDISIPSEDYDLVLDIMVTDDEQISWSYYYACHEARCLFWLETYDASYMISELYGVKSPAHVSALHL